MISASDTFKVNLENLYKLSAVAVLPQSETMILRGRILLPDDYSFSYSTNSFSLSKELAYSIFDTIIVNYKTIKLSLKKYYKNRELKPYYDYSSNDSLYSISKSSPLTTESIFGSNIQKSGTLIRGFTVGSNKDLTLQSGLRLQISGMLTDEIEVTAAITDENSPIQPEGNTETLDELDKVFIQLTHKNFGVVFGDYELQKRSGEFSAVNRRLQGLSGSFQMENINGFTAIASSKGKFNSQKLNGLDGVQGPYRLAGTNGEREIIVIAGTEKVFIDGEELLRGERNDYTIDYAVAELTFTTNKLITSASRITIDFEYTDRRFIRNFFAAGSGGKFLNDKLIVDLQYIREGDDQDSPIDLLLNESDKNILRSAGDNRLIASRSGVVLAPIDSNGIPKGVYEKVDSITVSDTITFYRYNPGSALSFYNVTFSFVGTGKGDYARQSAGNFVYISNGGGSYLPIVFLPLPELKQFGNISTQYSFSENIFVNLDFAGSLLDKNRFSNLDDGDNPGYAFNLKFSAKPTKISISSLNLGKIGFSYRERLTQKSFTSPDRFNDVEFDRNFNLQSSTQIADESLREISLSVIPIDEININSTYSILRKGDFNSNRSNNLLRIGNQKDYSFNYNIDYLSSDNKNFSTKWLRQKGDVNLNYIGLQPGVNYLSENRKEKISSADTILPSSFSFDEISPYLKYNSGSLTAAYSFYFREDNKYYSGELAKESNSTGHEIILRGSPTNNFNSEFKINVRDKKFSDEFKSLGNLDSRTILVRSQSRSYFFENKINGDLFYEVSTQKTARLEKIFVQVQKGSGNYIYKGDLNFNGIADEDEFEPVIYDGDYALLFIPSDELFPVIDLKLSTRWKLNFVNLFSGNSIIKSFVNSLSTETFWRIEENSQESDLKKIYLLNFSSFRNEVTTIRGSDYFQQDIFLFENNPSLSFRFRYSQRKSLVQYNAGNELGSGYERSLRIKFRLIEEVSNQTEVANKSDNAISKTNSNRNRTIESNSFSTDFSYRPERNLEIGFKVSAARSSDYFPANPTIINSNGQMLRINYSLGGSGRLRFETERNELNANLISNNIPFEMLAGNLIGKNYFWRLNLDYRISLNLQSTLSYDGRLQGAGRAIHTARAEVRAFF